MTLNNRLRILLELRPAFDDYAGIPQETRLLFRGLCTSQAQMQVEGLLQTSHTFLAAGVSQRPRSVSDGTGAARFHCCSRVIISIATPPSNRPLAAILRYVKRQRVVYALTCSAFLPRALGQIRTSWLEGRHFEDFIWRALFAKTLPATDFALITGRDFRICSIPRNVLQLVGLNTLKLVRRPRYPALATQGVDIFIAQTPFPARVGKKTALVVRYHDSLPVFMPHTIANRSRHEATHYHALMCNVRSGAFFACVSETTRQGLVDLFPEVQDRAITIHNMVSHHYNDDEAPAGRVPGIIRSRVNRSSPATLAAFTSRAEQERFYRRHLGEVPFNYVLVVSTIEPRKNHGRLIAAWEMVRAAVDPDLKLVVVGSLGWDCEPILRAMRPWIDSGAMFLLCDVPASDLRVLYRHAAATICPSLAEGFDFPGVEAMCSGGVVIASDIPVHREIYGDAAAYFDAYCAVGLASVMQMVLYDRNATALQERLRINGRRVSVRYSVDMILPQWEAFLRSVHERSAGCR